jgi:hypothetical protein
MTYTDHEQRVLDQQSGAALDRRMRVAGALHDDRFDEDAEARVRLVAAELRAWELVEVLRDAIAGTPHWRCGAERLLDAILNGELPEPHR